MTTAAATDVIALENVWFSHGDVPVLEDVSLRIEAGTFTGIIGPNGGGKTTLLKLVLGLLRPGRGAVKVFGEIVHGPGRGADRIGHVPQRSDVDWTFPARVVDVVMMGGFQRGRSARELRQEAEQRLRWLGMDNLAQRQIGRLSGGQQRRVFLARALMGQPKLLLLDEPCAGLDQETHRAFIRQLRDLQQRLGLAVVMVSHDIGELASASDRLACLSRRLHWHDAADLISDEILSDVYACELEAYRVRHQEICPEHGEHAH
jgi:zinc transport system ATP-binding protein